MDGREFLGVGAKNEKYPNPTTASSGASAFQIIQRSRDKEKKNLVPFRYKQQVFFKTCKASIVCLVCCSLLSYERAHVLSSLNLLCALQDVLSGEELVLGIDDDDDKVSLRLSVELLLVRATSRKGC